MPRISENNESGYLETYKYHYDEAFPGLCNGLLFYPFLHTSDNRGIESEEHGQRNNTIMLITLEPGRVEREEDENREKGVVKSL
jgi:hypothetical protein